jgi:hypothetical protein
VLQAQGIVFVLAMAIPVSKFTVYNGIFAGYTYLDSRRDPKKLKKLNFIDNEISRCFHVAIRSTAHAIIRWNFPKSFHHFRKIPFKSPSSSSSSLPPPPQVFSARPHRYHVVSVPHPEIGLKLGFACVKFTYSGIGQKKKKA